MENKKVTDIMTDDFLAHYGVLNMHWGIRRYQPYSLIPRKSGKGGKELGAAKRGSKTNNPIKKTLTKISKNKKTTNKVTAKKVSTTEKKGSSNKSRSQKSREAKVKYESEAKTAKQRAAQLDKILRSGDAKQIYEHKSELSSAQLKSAIDRLNTETQLKNIVASQNATPITKLKKLASKVDDANNIVRTGIKAYETASEIKGLIKSTKRKQAAELSSKTVKEIIGDGGYIPPESIVKQQHKLNNRDLKDLNDRIQNQSKLLEQQHKDNNYRRNDLNRTLNSINKFKDTLSVKSTTGDNFDKYVDAKTIKRMKDISKRNRKR